MITLVVTLINLVCELFTPSRPGLLRPGTRAVVAGPQATLFVHGGNPVPLAPGVRVTVGHDPYRRATDTSRLIQIVVESGEHKDVAGSIRRCDLREVEKS